MTAIDELAPPVGPSPGPLVAPPETELVVETTPAARPALVAMWRGLVLLGVLVLAFGLYLFVLSGFRQDRGQRSLEEDLRNDLVMRQVPIGGAIAPGTPIGMLEIPRLALRQVVLEGSTSRVTQAGPGHVRATPMPGQRGNAVLLGHRSAYGAPFAAIGSLHRGDRLRVTTGQGVSRFRVTGVRTTAAGARGVFTSGPEEVLTLVTGRTPVVGDGWTVVRAELVGKAKPSTPHLGRIERAEIGLAGDPVAWGALLAWLQALLAAALATVWLLRRYPAVSVWLVAGPVLAVLLWQVFEQVGVRVTPTL